MADTASKDTTKKTGTAKTVSKRPLLRTHNRRRRIGQG